VAVSAPESPSAALYPGHREADVVLRDGRTVRVRPLRPEDHDLLLELLRGLSAESRYFRFFGGGANIERAAADWARVDYHERFGLIALAGTSQQVIGHALYVVTTPGQAEVAFEVADEYQGLGLGSILLGELAEYAASAGVRAFEASVLPDNRRMIEVFTDSGFRVRTRRDAGVVSADFPTSLTREVVERFDRREQVASAAAMRRFFYPRSVAVVGASRDRLAPAGQLFHNILSGGFTGPVYPVNPKAESVQGVRAYPTVDDIPGPVDLGVISLPAALVPGAAAALAAKGAAALVVVSAGFAEAGGAALEAELLDVCRKSGMRLIGPNCLGIINTDPEVSLQATFSDARAVRGRIGFMSQSGALGISVLEYAATSDLGISTFVSAGNKADISGNDLLGYWESDPNTDLVLLYLESFGNPRKFARIARRVGKTKPIIAVKGGRSKAGSRAAGSHTAALISASDVTVDALFRQSGVIRTDTLGEMFGVARLLSMQPPPRGNRVAILTKAGGPAILCADSLEAAGMEVPPTSPGLQAALREFVSPAAAVGNPVDMLAAATPEDYARAMSLIARTGDYDAIVVIHVDVTKGESEAIRVAVEAAAKRLPRDIAIVAVLMSPDHGKSSTLPVYEFPEDAARALALAAAYGRFKREPAEHQRRPAGLDRPRAKRVIASALQRGEGWLTPDEMAEVLEAYGITTARAAVAGTPAEAAELAAKMGGPVALKAIAPGLVHKTEAAAVRLDLEGADAVAAAATELALAVKRAGHKLQGYLVQEMVRGGVEMIVGVVQDPQFGPVVACGAGGTQAELLGDVAVALTPVNHDDARRLLTSLRTYPLLTGYRGAPPTDTDAVADVVVRLAALADDHEAIAEIDLNPVVATPERAVVIDARMRVTAPAPQLPLLARRPYHLATKPESR